MAPEGAIPYMRRIALLSDIHGNRAALEAGLNDIASCALEEIYCLGDLVGYGPEPSQVIERVRSSGIPTVQGNYDEGIGARRGDCGCFYATDVARSDGEASYAFTEAAVDDADHEWLASLPHEIRFDYDGERILLVHGSPRKVNEYLLPDRLDAQLVRLADQAEADIVCVGHVHIPYHRAILTSDGRTIHYVSSGSVGKPKDGDSRAAWVELVLGSRAEVTGATHDQAAAAVGASDVWAGTIVHRVTYDVESVATAVIAAGMPAAFAEALRRA